MVSDEGPTIPSTAEATDGDEFGEEIGTTSWVVRLVDRHSSGERDDESELIGQDVPSVGLTSPEEEAMHIESDDSGGPPIR